MKTTAASLLVAGALLPISPATAAAMLQTADIEPWRASAPAPSKRLDLILAESGGRGGDPFVIDPDRNNNQIDSLDHSELRKCIETYLADELASVPPNAEIVALGQKGPRIMRHAAEVAGIDPRRVVALPHPSGSATGAVRDFLSKTKTLTGRPCRCMLCNRTRIPNGWDLSNRYQTHDLTHGRAAS